MAPLDEVLTSATGQGFVVADETGQGYYVALVEGGAWLVGFHLTCDRGQGLWEADAFTVRPAGHGRVINGSAVRSIPVGELLARARVLVSAASRGPTPLVDVSRVHLEPFLRDARGRAARTDEDYAHLALEYALRVRDGDRAPSVSLARQYGSTPGTWTYRIHDARKRGLLTETKRGQSGGLLTEKAERLLRLNWDAEIEAMSSQGQGAEAVEADHDA